MESFGVIVFIVIVFIIVISILYSSSPRRKYEKEVEKRSGIDKLSLMVSKDSIYLGNQFKKHSDDNSLWFSVNLPTMETHQALSGCFYGLLKETGESFGEKELFDELSSKVSSSEEKRLEVSSMMFGLAFGIVIKKIADTINADIKKSTIRKFIDSCEFDEAYKKNISKMAIEYLDLGASETKERWESLEKITYALLGTSIRRDKDDIADPIMIMPLKTALNYAHNKAAPSNSAMKELEKQGLIKPSKKSQNSLEDEIDEGYDDI